MERSDVVLYSVDTLLKLPFACDIPCLGIKLSPLIYRSWSERLVLGRLRSSQSVLVDWHLTVHVSLLSPDDSVLRVVGNRLSSDLVGLHSLIGAVLENRNTIDSVQSGLTGWGMLESLLGVKLTRRLEVDCSSALVVFTIVVESQETILSLRVQALDRSHADISGHDFGLV